MTAVTLTSNAQEVVAKFGRMVRGLEDTKGLRGLIGPLLVESTKRRYIDSQAPDGSTWAALAPSTLASYVAGFSKSLRRVKGGKPVAGNTSESLRPAGQARLAGRKPLVTGNAPAMGESYFWQNEGSNLVIATNHPHAAVHQFGSDPYTIVPKTKPALWIPAYGIKTKKVNHPGIKKRPALGISDADGDMMLVQTAEYIFKFTGP